MTRKRWSIILALLATPLATLVAPSAHAQVGAAFGFDQAPLSGPPGTPIFLTGRGCLGSTVSIRVISPFVGPREFFTVPVAANGTWFLRPLNLTVDSPPGRYGVTAACNAPSPVLTSVFDLLDAVNVRPEPVARSSPSLAAVRGSNRLDAVVRDAGNAIQWTSSNGGGWSPYTALGSPPGGAQGDPSIVSWAPGRLDLFAQGADNKLWQRFSTDGGAAWSPWIQPVGAEGALASGPKAASRGPGLIDVFVTGTDGGVYQRFWDGRQWNGTWLWFGAPGGGTPSPLPAVVGTPTATSSNGVNVDLLVRGSDDRIYRKEWNGSAWSDWHQPAGLHTGVAASRLDLASWGSGHLSAFVRGSDGWLYHSTHQEPTWFNFQRVGLLHQKVVDGPAAASRGFGRLDVVVRGTDDRLYHWRIG